MKTILVGLVTVAFLFLVCQPFAASLSAMSITGLVKQPLNLTIEDLEGFNSIEVQLNEVLRDGGFQGVFKYGGVPLRTLLELACIEKEETAFLKRVDLAILVRNKKGKEVALSWGEVFYRNPGRIIVAISAVPIMPHKDCKSCHSPEVYKPWLSQLQRNVGFPKLVVAGDTYADRSLEEITNIEVLNLWSKMPTKKAPRLFSPQFTIMGAVRKELTFEDLSSYLHREMLVKQVGEGKGYHGTKKFRGASLSRVLEDAELEANLSTVFLVSAPDGYRSLLSYGELFLARDGERIMIAERVADQPILKGGKFILILPDDLMADRWVKAVEKVQVISLSHVSGGRHRE
jgi:DMSO/TMAO reductase YedYZ molybdopterin-dependent catalytic subunit